MADDLLHLLSYARQPLVGAFIGYITTDLAIRLLFRPLKAWRILGIRIPLTPGVLPAKRDGFAERVGKMVGSHLLTPEDVRKALQKEGFRRELQGAVNEKLNELLGRELGTVASLFPPDFEGWIRELVERLRKKALDDLYQYMESAACQEEVRQFLRQREKEFLAREPEELLTADDYNSLRIRVRKGARDLLRSKELGGSLGSFVDGKIEELLASGARWREVVPAGVVKMAAARVEGELYAALERLVEDPLFRQHLRDSLQRAFTAALGSLEGMTGLLAKLLDPARIVALFPEVVAKLEQETLRWVQDEMTRQHLSSLLQDAIDSLLDQTVAATLGALPYRKTAALRRLARKKMVKLVRSPRLAKAVVTSLEAGFAKLSHRPMASLLGEAVSEQGLDNLRNLLLAEVLTSFRSPSAREAVERTVSAKVEEWLFQRPVGQIAAFIPASARDELGEMLYVQLAELLVSELPPLVDLINIQQIVEEKVNSLDILDMEGLLLGIMRESLMFLNLFGALLGFLIGILNLVVPGLSG